ncbi:UNVERIFIED_CONTAM: hypothetical protein FKN15_065482 [Acipenser sinensis]
MRGVTRVLLNISRKILQRYSLPAFHSAKYKSIACRHISFIEEDGQRPVMLTDAGCCQVINSPLEGTVVQQHPWYTTLHRAHDNSDSIFSLLYYPLPCRGSTIPQRDRQNRDRKGSAKGLIPRTAHLEPEAQPASFWNEGQLTLHGKEGSALCTETRTYLQESYLNIQNLCHLLSGYTEHHEGVEFLTWTHSKVAALQLCGPLPVRSPLPLHCPDTDPTRPVIRALNRNTAT